MAWNPLAHRQLVSKRCITRLSPVLKKLPVPYAITGAAAMQVYMPQRETYGIDVLVPEEHAATARKFLRRHSRAHDQVSDDDYYSLRWTKTAICQRNSLLSWVPQALDAAQQGTSYRESRIPILPLPWLILSKVTTASRQDFLDVARLIVRTTPAQLDTSVSLIKEHLPEALDELRALYRVGKTELKHAPTYQNQPDNYSPWYHTLAQVDTTQPLDLTLPPPPRRRK